MHLVLTIIITRLDMHHVSPGPCSNRDLVYGGMYTCIVSFLGVRSPQHMEPMTVSHVHVGVSVCMVGGACNQLYTEAVKVCKASLQD